MSVKCQLSLIESINKRRWTISSHQRTQPLSRVTSIQLVTPVTPCVPCKIRRAVHASTESRTRNTIVSRAARPPRSFRAVDVQYVRRTGNVRVHRVSMRNAESAPPSPLISVTHLHSPLPLRILRRESSHLHKYSRRWKRSLEAQPRRGRERKSSKREV